MSDNEFDLQLNLAELVNLAAKLLDRIFRQAPKDKIKPVFKELKNGKQIPLGHVTLDAKVDSDLKLALDYSEFKGPGFNFDVFAAALEGVLQQISDVFRDQGELNIMTSEDASVLIHLPGAVQIGEQLNVLVLAFEMADINNIVVKLMFVEPDQYEPYRRDR